MVQETQRRINEQQSTMTNEVGDSDVSPLHLGFVESIENEEQLRRIAHRSPNFDDWDGGQVGGCPSFLDPVHVPDSPQCHDCQTTMHFICQLYAPIDEYEDRAFHRTLYVFGCGKCQNESTRTIRVFRCQQPQENLYFPADPSNICTDVNDDDDDNVQDDWKQHLPDTHGVHLCQVCGMRGKYMCPLQQLYFCGKDHQKEYKKYIYDKIQNGEIPSELPSVFPLAEVAVDAEVLPSKEEEDNNVDQCDPLFPSNVSSGNGNDDDDDDSDAELEQEDLNRMTGRKQTVSQDKYTQTFMHRIKSQPDQALRYARWKAVAGNGATKTTDEEEKVLWIREDYRPTEIPPCPHCGSPRRFEFQLMPQLLDHLNRNVTVDPASAETYQQYKNALQQAEDLIREAPPETIPPALVENKERATERMRQYLLKQRKTTMEWGVVAVYTCVSSCGTPSDLDGSTSTGNASRLAYREEFAWRQPCLDLS